MYTAIQQTSHPPAGRSRSVGRQPEKLGCRQMVSADRAER